MTPRSFLPKLRSTSVGKSISQLNYALMLGTAGVESKKNALLKEAFDRFERNYQKAPQNTKNLQSWAFTLFNLWKYSEAWAKVKLAEATPNKAALDPQFLKALQSR